jgi:hypothetical protein
MGDAPVDLHRVANPARKQLPQAGWKNMFGNLSAWIEVNLLRLS